MLCEMQLVSSTIWTRWAIGMYGEKESEKSVLSAGFDDDNDDDTSLGEFPWRSD